MKGLPRVIGYEFGSNETDILTALEVAELRGWKRTSMSRFFDANHSDFAVEALPQDVSIDSDHRFALEVLP
jgi:hypothetical protein